MAMVAAGPSPGSTPINMPMTTPIRQYRRLVGSRTTVNPLITGFRKSTVFLLEEVGDGGVERQDEKAVERNHDDGADQQGGTPRLTAEEPHPDDAKDEGGQFEADHRHQRHHGGEGHQAAEGCRGHPGKFLRVPVVPSDDELEKPQEDHDAA